MRMGRSAGTAGGAPNANTASSHRRERLGRAPADDAPLSLGDLHYDASHRFSCGGRRVDTGRRRPIVAALQSAAGGIRSSIPRRSVATCQRKARAPAAS
jgi:hypothetical protein